MPCSVSSGMNKERNKAPLKSEVTDKRQTSHWTGQAVAREVLEDPRLKEIWGRISPPLLLTPFSTFTWTLPKVDCVTSSTIGAKVPEPQSALLEGIRRNRNKTRSQKIGRGDMVTRGDQQEVLIWTDSSKIHNGAGYGVYFGRNSNLNMVGRTLGDQTSENSELQVILRALELSTDLPSIHIITDNELVCNLVNKLLLRPNGRGV